MAKHADAPNGKLSEPSEAETSRSVADSDRPRSKSSNETEETTQAVGSGRQEAQADDVVGDKADVVPSMGEKESQKPADVADRAGRQFNVFSDVEDTSAAEDVLSPAEEEHGQEDEEQPDEHVDGTAETLGQRRFSTDQRVLVVGAIVMVALGCLVGWLGYRSYEARQAQAERDLLVQVARQGALNLTTIDYTRVESDVRRILDSSTGTFRDDFEQRSQPFIDVVKKAQSKSEGSVTAAGLETRDGNHAQVLVAVLVKTSNAGAPEQDPRRWRMRITVEKVSDGAKVSDVKFVPEQG